MYIEFDDKKDSFNIKKHGYSLSEAENFQWDDAICFEDKDLMYGEQRMVCFGYLNRKVVSLVYTEINDDVFKIINLRDATTHERRRYEQTIQI